MSIMGTDRTGDPSPRAERHGLEGTRWNVHSERYTPNKRETERDERCR